jgi:hypothetical protein
VTVAGVAAFRGFHDPPRNVISAAIRAKLNARRNSLKHDPEKPIQAKITSR